MHTSPKTAPGQPPPGTTTTHASHNAIACAIHDNIYEKNGGHHASERINLRQGVLGCSCGCRNRPNDDLQRVRQGVRVVSRAHERGIARRVQCKGRAGQRGAGIPFRMKILLPSSMAEDLTYAGGVVLKNTMESGGLPTRDSRARVRTACSNIQCAATALTPQPVQKPPDTRRQCKRSKCLDITSRAPGFCRQSTARARPAVGEEVRGPAHAISID